MVYQNAGRLSKLSFAKTQYVRTCHNDTCCCMSHDSGYYTSNLSAGSQLFQQYVRRHYRESNGDVHEHGYTYRSYGIASIRANRHGSEAIRFCKTVCEFRFFSDEEKGNTCRQITSAVDFVAARDVFYYAIELNNKRAAEWESRVSIVRELHKAELRAAADLRSHINSLQLAFAAIGY